MFPRNVFNEEHEQCRVSVRKFFEEEAVPHHEHWEEQGYVDRDLWIKAGERGFLCPTVPEEMGGIGADFRYNAILIEEVSRSGLTGVGFSLHSDIVVPYLVNEGSQEIQRQYLPGCLTGETVMAIAMTEPGTGSDLQGIKTTAVLDGDEYVINGAKTFITNGQQADVVVVVCRTDQRANAGSQAFSLILVDTKSPGFERGQNLKKAGMKAQDTSELFFNDVRVPRKNLIGEEGMGFFYLMKELPQERLCIALSGVAVCEELLRQTIEYVKERKAFGRAVSTFQNTQFKLAELDSEVTALRVFVDRCLELHLEGCLDAIGASKAKLLATELQSRVADECLQLHGGYGYMWEYPIARAWADGRVQRIYGGTSEVMKLIIGRSLVA